MKDFGFRAWLLTLPVPPRSRARLLRWFGARIGRNVRVHPVTVMDAGWKNLVIEDDCYVGPASILDLSGRLVLRRGSVVAAGAALLTHQDAGRSHGSPTALRLGSYTRSIEIGPFAFVGARAVVLADVGEGAVVGAGAVVVRRADPHTTVVGVPAVQAEGRS